MNLEAYRRLVAGETCTFVLSPRALWRLNGPDAERYLNGQVTADVAALAENRATYAAICTAKGRMEGDLHITRHAAEFYLDSDLAQHENLGPRLDKYLIADDALLEDVGNLWSLSHVFGSAAPSKPEAGFVVTHARFGLPGHDVWTAGTGASVTGDTVGAEFIETLRLEHGLPRWGIELTANTLPPEGGPHLLDAISYTKGCYVGQETIARLKSVGHVNRTLVFLESSSPDFPVPGTKLIRDGHETGTITSAGFSPRLARGIALGYVQRQASAEGAVCQAGGLRLTVAAPLHRRAKP
ncbi:MAG TPA: glycine cleavage T C-terminal barrel domain-containing protein [Candidatus Methylacidiphilales bacterium]|nr:glycine cleavage T C-terminal barrel domain-containing protein [Candidatus Methylacidiphilales bacterium]